MSVISIDALENSATLTDALVPSHRVKAEDIGVTWIPPNQAKIRVTGPLIQPETVMTALQTIKTLPKEWDWRKKASISPVFDQSTCGSCWAVSHVTCLADRWVIAAQKPRAPVLSPLSVANCSGRANDCHGGQPLVAADTSSKKGVVKNSCWPYSTEDCNGCGHARHRDESKCKTTECIKWYSTPHSGQHILVRKSHGVGVPTTRKELNIDATLKAIKTQIMLYGPVVTGIHVYADLVHNRGGIYVHNGNNKNLGAHAIVIVGWGHDAKSNKEYWIVRNSWGARWGNKGYFNCAMWPHNKLIGMDIPVEAKTSRGSSLFGGCFDFAVDLKRSPKHENEPNRSNGESPSGHTQIDYKNYGIALALVFLFSVLVYVVWYRRKR